MPCGGPEDVKWLELDILEVRSPNLKKGMKGRTRLSEGHEWVEFTVWEDGVAFISRAKLSRLLVGN